MEDRLRHARSPVQTLSPVHQMSVRAQINMSFKLLINSVHLQMLMPNASEIWLLHPQGHKQPSRNIFSKWSTRAWTKHQRLDLSPSQENRLKSLPSQTKHGGC